MLYKTRSKFLVLQVLCFPTCVPKAPRFKSPPRHATLSLAVLLTVFRPGLLKDYEMQGTSEKWNLHAGNLKCSTQNDECTIICTITCCIVVSCLVCIVVSCLVCIVVSCLVCIVVSCLVCVVVSCLVCIVVSCLVCIIVSFLCVLLLVVLCVLLLVVLYVLLLVSCVYCC